MNKPELISVYISSDHDQVEEIYCSKMKERPDGTCVLKGKWTPGYKMIVKTADILGVRTLIRE